MKISTTTKTAWDKLYNPNLPAELRLIPHLVPSPLWGISAAKRLGRTATWQAIREAAFAAAKRRCQLCGAVPERLHCHEKWDYDDDRKTATLAGFVSICDACHGVIHIGQSTSAGKKGEAMPHLCRINGIDAEVGKKVVHRAFHVWQWRSNQKWKVSVSPALLETYPQLAKLQR